MEMWQQQSAHGLVLLSGLRWLWGHEDMRGSGPKPGSWRTPSSPATAQNRTDLLPLKRSSSRITSQTAADLHFEQPSSAAEPRHPLGSPGAVSGAPRQGG